MKLTIRGAASEVGRSCIEVQTRKTNVLLDCGIKLGDGGTELPLLPTNTHELDGVFISHAHLDHTGALPALEHHGYKGPIFATRMTKALSQILLKDSLKIGRLNHQEMDYDEFDVKDVLKFMKRIKLNESGSLKDIDYKFFDAGHIPGSSSILLAANNKKLLYSGDVNYYDTKLMKKADTDYYMEQHQGPLTGMIVEATYGDREHPDREREERRFLAQVLEGIQHGSVIIPVFAVGRAQEILLVLLDQINKINCPIYLDGMSKDITKLFLRYPETIRDPKKLEKIVSTIKFVTSSEMRRKISKQRAIFVTTSGMLTGGPVLQYLRKNHSDAKASILLTGYQAEHTNGDMLLKQQQVYIDGWRTKVKCKVAKFDFSAHSGLFGLKQMIKDANPETLILNHGDPSAIKHLGDWAQAVDFTVKIPKLGDIIKL